MADEAPLPTAPIVGVGGRIHQLTHIVDSAGRITHKATPDGRMVPVEPRSTPRTPAPPPSPRPDGIAEAVWRDAPLPTIGGPRQSTAAPADRETNVAPSMDELNERVRKLLGE